MGNTKLSRWRCKFCGASIYYTQHETRENVIASHFQRCLAIHRELVTLFERMAIQQKTRKE